ncbi:glycoside hydrolase family 43 protein [Streptomyces sp. NPDC059382]|uniref:glycoside hydrolase family 43 protein n=1 Tax=Streptomyces sp. NPDC059382 TaxID=3346816 RepID=UPI00368F3746
MAGAALAAVLGTLWLAAAPVGARADAGHRRAATAATPLAAPARAPVGEPVLNQDFPDPDVVKVGGTYHAYATNTGGKNIQHATSRDLTHWSVDPGSVLPALGAWAEELPGQVWAPEVYANGRGFTMQYTARDRASGRQCVGVALASSPAGPFRPAGDAPLVCPVASGGAIDAAGHTENGRRYLLWKSDGNCCRADTWIHLQPTTWDGTRTTGDPVPLIRQDRDWEGALVEAPTLVKRGDRYVLFYSADAYGGDGYKIGYAVADALTGPYTKAPEPLVTTESLAGAVRGPGGQDVVTGPGGRDRLLFHGWSPDGRGRVMYLADLVFEDGRPVVRGDRAR